MTDADNRARERAARSSGDRWEEYRRRCELVRAGRAREAGLRRGDRVERMVWRGGGTSLGQWRPEGVLCWVLRVTPAGRRREGSSATRRNASMGIRHGEGRTAPDEAVFEAHTCFGIGELRIQTEEAGGSGATGNVTITGGFSGPPGFPMVFPEEES